MLEEEKEQLVRLQANCLCGGEIIGIQRAEEAKKLQEMGATGVYVESSQESLFTTLSEIKKGGLSIPLFYEEGTDCDDIHHHVFGGEGLGYFVLSPHRTEERPCLSRRWFRIDHENDLVYVQPNALAFVTCSLSLLEKLKERRDQWASQCSIFFEAIRKEDAYTAQMIGSDGILLRSFDLSGSIEVMNELKERKLRPTLLIGVISLQGDYQVHIDELNRCVQGFDVHLNVKVVKITSARELAFLDGVVLPGGWSNVQSLLYERSGIASELQRFVLQGGSVLGVCAGMILLGSKSGKDCEDRKLLGLIDVEIDNNQLNGSQCISLDTGEEENAFFSNAPIAKALGSNVLPLAWLSQSKEKKVVAAQQGNVFIAAYHTGKSVHLRFLKHLIRNRTITLQ